ncbi:MAG TPA: helix-turn-helix transcriptional regulator [Pirellulales bacterium]|jgi:DNA-binding XRE family transcriptional regulator|nr:helix-turn-helix transcriptional regulator [Pirellulales bacterium]
MAKQSPKRQSKRQSKRLEKQQAIQRPKRTIRDRRLTKEEIAADNSVRKKFRGKPSLKSLLASGDFTDPMPTTDYVALVKVMARLKQARTSQKISLNELAQRSGIDKGTISKLENGVFDNPTIGTIQRYASAIGKGIVVGVIDLPAGGAEDYAVG